MRLVRACDHHGVWGRVSERVQIGREARAGRTGALLCRVSVDAENKVYITGSGEYRCVVSAEEAQPDDCASDRTDRLGGQLDGNAASGERGDSGLEVADRVALNWLAVP